MSIDTIIAINKTVNDIDKIADIMGLLNDLLTVVPEGHDLYSPQTGEIIGHDDLSRVLGVLSGLQESSLWELHGEL